MNEEIEYGKKSMYNLLGGDIDGNSNKNAEFDYKLKSESYGLNKRFDIALGVLQLFKHNPKMSFDSFEQYLTEKHGEETAKKMMDMITDDLKYVGQIVDALKYNKGQSDIDYAKNAPTHKTV